MKLERGERGNKENRMGKIRKLAVLAAKALLPSALILGGCGNCNGNAPQRTPDAGINQPQEADAQVDPGPTITLPEKTIAGTVDGEWYSSEQQPIEDADPAKAIVITTGHDGVLRALFTKMEVLPDGGFTVSNWQRIENGRDEDVPDAAVAETPVDTVPVLDTRNMTVDEILDARSNGQLTQEQMLRALEGREIDVRFRIVNGNLQIVE